MPAYTIPVAVVIEAASPAAALAIATKAQGLLNQPFLKTMFASQGLPVQSAKVGAPVPGTT